MNPTLRNILAIITGWFVGSLVNYAIILLGSSIVAMPDGVVTGDMVSLKAHAHLFEAQHFIFPFLAHAGGALVGAWVAAKVGVSQFFRLAMIVGAAFFLGGLYVAFDFDFPLWMDIVDLLFAYFPMAWLGWKLSGR